MSDLNRDKIDKEIASTVGVYEQDRGAIAQARKRAVRAYNIDTGDRGIEVEVKGGGKTFSKKPKVAGKFIKFKNSIIKGTSLLPALLIFIMAFFFIFA